MGKISYFYDLEVIYKDFISENINCSHSLIKKTSETKWKQELPMDKCCSVSVQNGLLIQIQSKFELLNSTVQPEDDPVPSELFFVI